MIISASRRTDIPAFFSRWFFNRLNEGFVLVQNPMNPRSIGKIPLNPGLIDCIVFWTKNPRNLMQKLDQLKDYHYYFLFTITGYGRDLERHLPPKEEIIDTFRQLSREIGREKVIWRYDPILISDKIDEDFHYRNFSDIAEKLQTYTGRCIISFLDMYKKCERNLRGFHIKRELTAGEMSRLAGMLGRVAAGCGMEMVTCAEEIDLTAANIKHGRCIDDQLIANICGYPLDTKKDKHQRKTCRCVESIDIGAYNTCSHICLYCYANSDARAVQENMTRHNPDSPLLLGEVPPDSEMIIKERKVQSFRKNYRNGTLKF